MSNTSADRFIKSYDKLDRLPATKLNRRQNKLRLGAHAALRIAFLTAMSLVSMAYSSSPTQPAIYSSGQIHYPPKPGSQKALFGWGGYVSTISAVEPILDDLNASGYSAIRYWAAPAWYSGSGLHVLNFNVLDFLIAAAAERGITVYIDPEHNYPPSDFIKGRETEWINDLITVGQRYNNDGNVVLECVNEYTGDNQPALYNQAISSLRVNGIHLPLLFNFWWNQKNVALIDPENNYAIGRHLYGSSFANYNPTTPMLLENAVAESGINSSMKHYFDDPSQTLYLQEVNRLKIPNGWVITELGPTDNESMVSNPSAGNMAFAMYFLREAASHGVTVICYRIGDSSKKAIYEQKAQEFFLEDFFIPPT